MIYLHRYSTSDKGDTTIDIAACEDGDRAGRYEAQGYVRCTPDRVAWRARDARDRARIAVEDWLARQNEPAPTPGTAIGKTKDGLTIYKGDK